MLLQVFYVLNGSGCIKILVLDITTNKIHGSVNLYAKLAGTMLCVVLINNIERKKYSFSRF